MDLSCHFLNLSTELLIEILSYLPATDLLSVRRTCRTLRDVVASTSYFQYILRTHITGVDDFLPSDFPYPERLELLQRHEQSWNDLNLNLFTECVAEISFIDEFFLQGGYLIHTHFMRLVLAYGYTDLCSAIQGEELDWVHISIDNGLDFILSTTAFAVDQDLMVAIRFGVLSK